MEAIDTSEPIHEYFGLSYASYLVLPRSALQSMPVEWQRRLVQLLQEGAALIEDVAPPGGYRVQAVDEHGRSIRDPYGDYERGRRRLPLRTTAGDSTNAREPT